MLVELLNSCSTLNFGASLCGWTFPCVRLALSNAFGAKLWILLLPVNEVMGVGGRGRVVNGGGISAQRISALWSSEFALWVE